MDNEAVEADFKIEFGLQGVEDVFHKSGRIAGWRMAVRMTTAANHPWPQKNDRKEPRLANGAMEGCGEVCFTRKRRLTISRRFSSLWTCQKVWTDLSNGHIQRR
jgi:hypothetical protein